MSARAAREIVRDFEAFASKDVPIQGLRDSLSGRQDGIFKIATSGGVQPPSALELAPAGSQCHECGGTGVVNAFDGKDIGGNSFENWPSPCPRCTATPEPAAVEYMESDPLSANKHWRWKMDRQGVHVHCGDGEWRPSHNSTMRFNDMIGDGFFVKVRG